MSKFNKELMHKYAYNINDSTKGKKVKIGSGKDFIQSHRGFYEEIENKDISIKEKEKELRKIKNDSLKEFVFTNKQIPEKWKKKLTYQKDIIRILAKDNNFLYYVGRGGQSNMNETASTKMYSTDSFKNTGKSKGFKTSYSQIFPKINNKYLSQDKTNSKIESINKIENKSLEEEDLSINENTVSNIKMPNTKYKLNKKDAMTEKDIANLLEEFKLAYPIKVKKEEQHEESPEDKKKENDLENNKNNLLFSRTYNLSSSLLQTRRGYNPFDNIHKIKAKRQRAFRQNIFNNLIPLKNKNISYNMINLNSNGKLKKIKINQKDEKYGPFLNFDNEKFYKRIKINNPVIERQLDNINFYGPYYSYCPPCLNRNLEYYNYLEPNQCLKLIQYIRKIRKKNIINIKENTTRSTEHKLDKKRSSFDENLNDNETIVEKKESIELSQ
jgi:hypothetical protein